MADFSTAHAPVAVWEGGYGNHPADRGGETLCGIARGCHPDLALWKLVDAEKDHPSFRQGSAAFTRHLRQIPGLLEQVTAFYRGLFHSLGLDSDDMPQDLANEIYEQVVNLGQGGHTRYLQRICNAFNYNRKTGTRLFHDLKEDGALGTLTGAAFEQVTGTVLARMEAAKAAATTPLDALKQAGERLQTQLGAAVKKIDALKQAMQGTNASWFGAYLSGDLGELSRDLSLIAPPANAAHKLTAALLFVGSAPQLAYFQETFLPMITMRLDDYKVPGFGLRVSGSFTLKKQDASGDTSSTAKAEKGIKAKTLTVMTQIRYKDESDLRELIRVSEAKGGSGAKVYTIANTTANAAGIRQVVFSDRVSWDEQEGRKCWNVQFTLAEYKSVPERAEAREKAKPASAGQNAGGTVSPAGEGAGEEKLEGIWRYVKGFNDWIAGYGSVDSETADKK